MRAGDLRHRVTIQQKAEVPDGRGGRTQEWIDVCTVWAAKKLNTLHSRERTEAQQLQSVSYETFIIRYRPGITAGMRVVCEGRYFYLQGPPIDVGRKTYMQLICEEKAE